MTLIEQFIFRLGSAFVFELNVDSAVPFDLFFSFGLLILCMHTVLRVEMCESKNPPTPEVI